MGTKRRLPGSFVISFEDVPGHGPGIPTLSHHRFRTGRNLGRQLVPVGVHFDLATAAHPLADADGDLNSENQTPHEELPAPPPAAEITTSSASSGALPHHGPESTPSAQQTVVSDDGSFVPVAKRRRTQSDLANSMAAHHIERTAVRTYLDLLQKEQARKELLARGYGSSHKPSKDICEELVVNINDHIGSNVGPPFTDFIHCH